MRTETILHSCGHEETHHVRTHSDQRWANPAVHCSKCRDGKTHPDYEHTRLMRDVDRAARKSDRAREKLIDAAIAAENAEYVTEVVSLYGIVRIEPADDCWRVVVLKNGTHRVQAEFSDGPDDGPLMIQNTSCSCGNPNCSAPHAAYDYYLAASRPSDHDRDYYAGRD